MTPYHDRQVVVLGPDHWSAWLNGAAPEGALLRAGPPGTLRVSEGAAKAAPLPLFDR